MLGVAGLAARAGRRPSSSSASTSGASARTDDAHRGHRSAALHRHLARHRRRRRRCSGSSRPPPRSGPTARRRPRATPGCSSKARGDYRRLLAALYAAGYYGPAISIRAAGQEVADADARRRVPAAGAGGDRRQRRAALPLRPAPRSSTRRRPRPSSATTIETPASAGFAPGETARSGIINQASALTIEQWRQLSRAKAREADREVIADHATEPARRHADHRPGPGGALRADRASRAASGSTRRSSPSWPTCRRASRSTPTTSQDGQDRLNRLGVFRSLRFEEAEEIGPDGSLPITVRVEDRRPRTIGVGATYSTIDGIGVAAFWEHRNLFGRAERLRFDGQRRRARRRSTRTTSTTRSASTFTKPGVWTPDTNFVTGAVGLAASTTRPTASRSITASVGLTQQFSRRLTGEPDRAGLARRATRTTSASATSPSCR